MAGSCCVLIRQEQLHITACSSFPALNSIKPWPASDTQTDKRANDTRTSKTAKVLVYPLFILYLVNIDFNTCLAVLPSVKALRFSTGERQTWEHSDQSLIPLTWPCLGSWHCASTFLLSHTEYKALMHYPLGVCVCVCVSDRDWDQCPFIQAYRAHTQQQKHPLYHCLCPNFLPMSDYISTNSTPFYKKQCKSFQTLIQQCIHYTLFNTFL